MKKPKILNQKMLFQGFFDVRQDLLQREDGETSTYTHCILAKNAAVILAQTSDGKFILNREYRHPVGKELLGCPGGRLEEGENPLEGALREFQEETGYFSDDIQEIGVCYPFPGVCNQKIHFFFAQNAYLKSAPSLDPFEFIQLELKSEKELYAEIARGQAIDGLLVTALGYWKLSLKN
ncbi:MAG TPA: NUDIX hydrolase [Chlamydiales bacterium]|jgi:ADP-ribose pyrophosphatase